MISYERIVIAVASIRSDRSSDRFSDTMRKQSERTEQPKHSDEQLITLIIAQGTTEHDNTDKTQATDGNATPRNDDQLDGLEVAELAQLGLISIQSDVAELPSINIQFQQAGTDPQQQAAVLAQTGESALVDTDVELVLDNGVQAAAVLGTPVLNNEQEGTTTSNPAISSLDAETAETLMPAQTEAELDQDNQFSQQQQQKAVPVMQTAQVQQVQQTDNADGEAELQVQQVQQSSSSTQQNSSPIVGSDQGKIQIQDFQSVMNNTKVDAPQTTAQQDLNAMDKAVGKQIERAVVQQLQNGQKVLQIRLTPPELGTVKVEILEQSGRMTVRLQAEDESVRMSLEKAIPQLRGDLRASNAPIADVQLTDHNFLMNQHRQAQHQQQQRRRQQQGQAFEIDGVPQPEQTNQAKQETSGVTINSRGVNGIV